MVWIKLFWYYFWLLLLSDYDFKWNKNKYVLLFLWNFFMSPSDKNLAGDMWVRPTKDCLKYEFVLQISNWQTKMLVDTVGGEMDTNNVEWFLMEQMSMDTKLTWV